MYAVDISEFKKLHAQRQHPRQCQLKNEFILYLRISVYHCQNYHKTESGTRQ